jgi:hypothetical protein
MAKVTLAPGALRTACWLWDGALSRKRYDQRRPSFWLNGIAQNAARVMCAWVHGPAPSADHHAGHTCPSGENSRCVSPFHLVWQSPHDNYEARRTRCSDRSLSS